MSESGGRQQRTVTYRGMVQGVGFRYTTRRVASRFNVTGYVQNLPDGRVILLVEGATAEVARFLGALRTQMADFIQDESEEIGPATDQFRHFDIRY